MTMFTGCTVWARATKLPIESYVGTSERSKRHLAGGEVVAKSLIRRVAELSVELFCCVGSRTLLRVDMIDCK